MRAGEAILWLDAFFVASATAWVLVVAYTPLPDYALLRRLAWFIALCLWVFALVWDVTSNSPFPMRLLVTGVVFAVAGVLLCEGIRWSYRAAASASNVDIKPADSVPTIFLECLSSSLPKVMPESGVFWTLSLQTDAIGSGFGHAAGPPGMDIGPSPLMEVYRCDVTNYSAGPVANVEMTLDVVTYDAVPTDNGFNSGKETARKNVNLKIPKIDPGKNNQFTFYAFNTSKKFMNVSFLENIKVTVIEDKTIHDAKLQQSSYLTQLHFVPRP
jgi:hypothetical protein